MKTIQRYYLNAPTDTVVESDKGVWVKWPDVEALLAQLPEGMKHCSIILQECDKGHHWLSAMNWIDHGCPTCKEQTLQQELNELRAKAFAAVWLLPEDIGVRELLELREEAREVFLGKDKQIIAKLQDELRYAQEYAQQIQRPLRPGVNTVFGVSRKDQTTRHALMLLGISTTPNGGLEIEVQLP